MSEHKLKKAKVDTTDYSATTTDAWVLQKRQENANPGFFLKAATYILARFPLTKHRYQNWTPARRVLVGWLLWLIVLPIIPIVAAVVWYLNDPQGFKKSPWAKALIALAVLWTGYAGAVVTEQPVVDCNGKYSLCQTAANGETKGSANATNTASEEAKNKIATRKESANSRGRTFVNCTEAFNAGVFNIKRSNASYQPKLDRDSDGIACEK